MGRAVRLRVQGRWGIETVGTLPPGDTRLASCPLPGQDLRLSYHSAIDDTEQPYALYVPAGYDGRRSWPLVINLHGTSAGLSPECVGQTSEHYTADENAAPLWAAERHGALLVTPFGRGITEFRGIGENDVFCAVADVQRRYRVDAERISVTGLSMGGTGSSELALHYPDYFAAAAPMGAAYSFPWLAANGEHLPFWCIGGEHDRNFQLGGRLVADRMERLNFPTRLDIRAGRGHADFVPEYYDGVIAWLVRQRLRRHPTGYSFSAALPLHGQAYWTAIDAIERPGTIGTVHAQIIGANRLRLATDNLTGVAVLPDPALVDLARPLALEIEGQAVFEGVVTADRELRLTKQAGRWPVAEAPRRQRSLTAYRTHPVAEAPASLTMSGIEAPLANWITDAMRLATGADLALYNRRSYRGLPLPAGTVDEVDLIQCSRPFEQYLVVADMTGGGVLSILEANVNPDEGLEFIVQLSGASYTFDWGRPVGQRIVAHTLDPERRYRVALEGHVPERGQGRSMHLSGRREGLSYSITDVPFRAALYAHAVRSGRIEAAVEGRVRAVGGWWGGPDLPTPRHHT